MVDTNVVYNSAIRMLGRREHSEAELTTKLQRKFQSVSADVFAAVIARLKQSDLQCDARYAEMLIRSRISKGYGPYYIRRELAAKGIDGDLAEAQLDTTDTNWLGVATDLVERRHSDAAHDVDAWARAIRFLQRRGFSGDIVTKAAGDRPTQN